MTVTEERTGRFLRRMDMRLAFRVGASVLPALATALPWIWQDYLPWAFEADPGSYDARWEVYPVQLGLVVACSMALLIVSFTSDRAPMRTAFIGLVAACAGIACTMSTAYPPSWISAPAVGFIISLIGFSVSGVTIGCRLDRRLALRAGVSLLPAVATVLPWIWHDDIVDFDKGSFSGSGWVDYPVRVGLVAACSLALLVSSFTSHRAPRRSASVGLIAACAGIACTASTLFVTWSGRKDPTLGFFMSVLGFSLSAAIILHRLWRDARQSRERTVAQLL